MVQYNWNVDGEERKRILSLHENATKNHYLLTEQEKKEIANIDFTTLYPPGKYLITQQINSKLSQEFGNLIPKLKPYKDQTIEVTVHAGESQVQNYDNEKSPAVKLGKGKLAELRAFHLTDMLKKYFKAYDEQIKLNPVYTRPVIKIGETAAKPGKAFSSYTKDEQSKFLSEQYVRVVIKSSGTSTTDPFAAFAAGGESVFMNNELVGVIGMKFRDTKELKDVGIVAGTNDIYVFTSIDRSTNKYNGAYKVPAAWWNSGRPRYIPTRISQEDLNIILSANTAPGGVVNFSYTTDNGMTKTQGKIEKIPLKGSEAYTQR